MFPISRFVSESAAADLLQQVRWRDGVECPRCRSDLTVGNGSYRVYQRYLCKNCGRTFNDKTDTIFAHSKMKLKEWYFTIYIFLRFNTSLRQIEAELDLSYRTVRRRVERSIDAGHFDVRAVETTPLLSRLRSNDDLSDADAAVLACADSHDGVAVMDETYGRDVAAVEGITTRGTAYLVLKLATAGAIGTDEARTVIDDMVDAGWYCAPGVYTRIVRKLDDLADDADEP